MVDAKRQKMIAFAFDDAIEKDGFAPNGYTNLLELDRGGMSVIYSAEQIDPQREVALKIILPKYTGDEHVRERFQREARVMAHLDHPAILPIYQIGEWDGLSFIAMKMASGGNLDEVLKKGSPSIDKIVDWVISAGEAVHFAHQSGVLHRDLKPSNLLFDHTGAIFVSDFGVAKMTLGKNNSLTMTEALVGTPHYLAPEVASGEVLGGNVTTDQYGLGTILYQCLTGKRPYDGGKENLAAQLREIVEQDLLGVKKLAPDTPKDLCVICEKAMAKNPTERYLSVVDFVEDLKRWRAALPIKARPAGLLEKYWMWTRRYPLASALSLLLIGTLIASGILFAHNYEKRGELLFESLLERAKSERLVQRPLFRSRVINLLSSARELQSSDKIQQEVIASLSHWDVASSNDSKKFVAQFTDHQSCYKIEEKEGRLVLINRTDGQARQVALDGVLRCPAVCSMDGKWLAFVRGEDIEIVIYNIEKRSVFSVIPVEAWPIGIHFSDSGDVIKAVFEGKEASLYNLRGDIMLRNFHSHENLTKPVGFSLWKGHSIHSRQANPYGCECSPDQRHLATTSALGVYIWRCATGEVVDFYETSSQRIDTPTDAWWLDDKRLLVQVPGAQEIIEIDEAGRIVKKSGHPRVPGSIVKDILVNGDWGVEVRDEDGSSVMELWKDGDFRNASDWTPANDEELVSHEGGVISYNNWKLTLPRDSEILETVLIENNEKLVVLTSDYDIYEWDLRVLAEELVRLNFSHPRKPN